MKKRNKLTLGIIGLATVALFVSGCTANFSTNEEKSRIAYALDSKIIKYADPDNNEKTRNSLKSGVSEFVLEGSYNTTEVEIDNLVEGKLHQIVRVTKDDNGNITSYNDASLLNQAISSAKSSSIAIPTATYFVKLDKAGFDLAYEGYKAEKGAVDFNSISYDDFNNWLEEFYDFGYLKFYNPADNSVYGNYTSINRNLRNTEDYTSVASVDFEGYYLSSLSATVEKYRSTITVIDNKKIKYGNYNGNQIVLEQVTWKDAWGKGGHLIEGLIVYPVAWMIDSFAIAFAGGRNADASGIQAQYKTGVPQILAILVVTVIVRLFIFLCTFRSTLAQKKMTELQPELAKIQQKYPNANTNQAQKQRLAEEQMRLYKKHKVNPLSQLLVLIIQFPVFIGVWGAMTGSAVLSTGSFWGLHLSASIWETLKQGPKNVANGGWWTALVLILLMSAGQFFAMKVPQWIQKAKTKNVAKLGKNPAQKQQNRTANMVSYVMLAMIIVMGFTLPAAMGVYWFVGAIVSLIQTVFTQVVFAGGKKKK